MSSFAKYVLKLQQLAQQNIDILNLINDSLYSNQEHVTTTINGTQYSIPSFLFLENKLAQLEGNWKRLIDAPLTGETAFALDNGTKKIQVMGFDNAPMPISYDADNYFTEDTDGALKDLLCPRLSVRFDLGNLPDYVSQVNVRKVIFKNKDAQLLAQEQIAKSAAWGDFSNFLITLKRNEYDQYDKTYDLPLKQNDVIGDFKVVSVKTESTETFPIFTCELCSYHSEDGTFHPEEKLSYSYDNGTLRRDLRVNDYLLSENGECKYVIDEIDKTNNTVVLRVVDGYKRIVSCTASDKDATTYRPDGTTLRYYKNSKYNDYKYINIPVTLDYFSDDDENTDEPKYIYVFISPISSSLHIQGSFGECKVINPNTLTSQDGKEKFVDYYSRNVYDLTQFIELMKEGKFTEHVSEYKEIPIKDSENAEPGYHNAKHIYYEKEDDTIKSISEYIENFEDRIETLESEIKNLKDKIEILEGWDIKTKLDEFDRRIIRLEAKQS